MKKKIALLMATILLCMCLVGCQSNDEVSLRKILTLETKEDVNKLFGESTSEDSEKYEIIFLDNPLDVRPQYTSDDELLNLAIEYELVGMRDLIYAVDILDYKATREDVKEAEEYVERLFECFEEELGKPEVFYSPVETATYTWKKDGITIELSNCLDNASLLTFSPISIRVQYK